MQKQIVITGDRPTGKLHLGHYVGSLKNRVEMQNTEKYEMYIFIADLQGLTDNAKNPSKIKDSIIEVAMDNLSVGIDPSKTTYFIQSGVPELSELNMYYLNLVTLARLKRNPTIKEEIKQRGFNENIPAGFLTYPISQAADITAFDADLVPVGEDQIPIMEQVCEIVDTFNDTYGYTLVRPKYIVPDSLCCRRLPGTDGKLKMSKSAGNCIYLSDDKETVKNKVMAMYTDPLHVKITDKGDTKNNTVFIYLDAFCKDREKYKELKNHYEAGGLGDVEVKRYLIEVLEEILTPIREKRAYYETHKEEVYKILKEGTSKARIKAQATLSKVRKNIGVEYFN
ncbi:MAG: tryptophan--tRNA ligase [Bacilli bacterium]